MHEQTPKYKNESLRCKERAEDLVSRMTVEECASQMLFGAAEIERLGVPAYNWWNEALHGVARAGVATIFPQAIGLAATFDEKLALQEAEVISTEARAKYNQFQKQNDHGIYKGLTHWSPNINIFRDPRWGRGQETYGEDPYLTAKLGVSFVKGLQGNDPTCMKVAACAKHFAVHSGPEKKRHEFNAVVSQQDLYETYLPAFKALCDVKVEGFMGAYNRTNGEPCCGSETLLKKILREDWQFDGYITSDCWAISDFHNHHHVTDLPTESVALALKNGCDLNCGNMYGYVMAAYQEGLISEEDIRTACVHLFTTRMRLGMFNEKTPYDDIPYDVVDCEEHRRLNYEIACRSMVLLKNDGVLPLDKKKIQNIAVIGPNANEVAPLIGNYHGTPGYYITLLQGITEALPDARVWFAQGSHLYLNHIEDIGPEGDGLAEAKTLCEQADAVVLAVGLTEAVEGEEMGDQNMVGDKATLYLPEGQRALIRTVCDSGKPVILVNFSGSAIDFEYGNEHANAIIQAWYPGALGGRAVAELIFGEYSPSGKLPVTFYPEENSLPDFEDYSMENRTYKFYKENPLYPFGYGLSYSHFLFSDIVLSAEKVKAGDSILCTVTVTNTGKMEAEEVVEFYIRDQEASVRVPRHKLCGIQRVSLKPQESCRITVEIGPEAMQITDEQGCYRYESGNFTVFAGGCQPDPYSQHLYGSSCVQAEFELLV